MEQAQRPLSPHLGIYRWRVTMLLSSLHRISGLLMALGAVALAVWLLALAGGAETYEGIRQAYSSGPFKLLVLLWILCFFLHLFNGVRHLFWDGGYGFEKSTARATGMAVVVAALIATGIFATAAFA